MDPSWKVNIEHKGFIPQNPSADIKFHHGTFRGYGIGITDCDGTEELAAFACKLYEIDNIHDLMKKDPNYFFNTKEVCWLYTGKVGNAPDIIGLGNSNDIHIGELKWMEGIRVEQIEAYINNEIWSKDSEKKDLIVHITSPQTVSRETISQVIKAVDSAKNWKSTRCYFGFMQFGWDISNNYFLKTIWCDGSKCNTRE